MLVFLLFPKTFLRGSSLTSNTWKNRLANTDFSDCSGNTRVIQGPDELELGGNMCNTQAGDAANTGTLSPFRDFGWPKAEQELVCCHIRHEGFFSPLRFPLEASGKNETGRKHPRTPIVACIEYITNTAVIQVFWRIKCACGRNTQVLCYMATNSVLKTWKSFLQLRI